jgi:hypothetical protein
VALREFLNEKRQYITGLTIAIIGVFFVLIVIELITSRRSIPTEDSKAFFTTDDGKTWFEDDASNVPPYDYNGQQAVRAYVFSYSGGQFVGYMEEYPPNIRDGLAAATTDEQRSQFDPEYQVRCKRPASKYWVQEKSIRGQQIVNNIIAPNKNKNEVITAVEP